MLLPNILALDFVQQPNFGFGTVKMSVLEEHEKREFYVRTV